MKNIVIIGAGSLGKEVVWLIEDINKVNPTYLILGFLDDDLGKAQTEYCGYKVLGQISQLDSIASRMPVCAVIAIQNEKSKKAIVEKNPSFKNWENIIHPSSVIAGSTTYGVGNIFFPQTVISIDCKLGNFGLYSIHSSVANDCVIGDYVSIMQSSTISNHVRINDLVRIKDNEYVTSETHKGKGLGIL